MPHRISLAPGSAITLFRKGFCIVVKSGRRKRTMDHPVEIMCNGYLIGKGILKTIGFFKRYKNGEVDKVLLGSQNLNPNDEKYIISQLRQYRNNIVTVYKITLTKKRMNEKYLLTLLEGKNTNSHKN